MDQGARAGARIVLLGAWAAAWLGLALLSPWCGDLGAQEVVFEEGFEAGLDRWRFPLGAGYTLVETGDRDRGTALALRTASTATYALIRGSEAWGNVRIEGDLFFPDDSDNYLGFIYRYSDDGRRIDFGSLYIKGNGSYIQANPHHDSNVGRTVFPEMRVGLDGARAIVSGEWKWFAFEVVGSEAHLYVGEENFPAMTVTLPAPLEGAFGFKPRNPGGAVWIDNLTVRRIGGHRYRGPPIPAAPYRREDRVGSWEVLGPLTRFLAEVEAGNGAGPGRPVFDDGRELTWQPFRADPRGAVLTGWVTEHRGARKVAYFRTKIITSCTVDAVLEFGTADDLTLWLNGNFLGFAPRQTVAWWDAGEHPDHRPVRSMVRLEEGENPLLVRVVGGAYATGGFFLGVRRQADRSQTLCDES